MPEIPADIDRLIRSEATVRLCRGKFSSKEHLKSALCWLKARLGDNSPSFRLLPYGSLDPWGSRIRAKPLALDIQGGKFLNQTKA